MVIDVHTHLNNYDESVTVPLEKRLDQLQESMAFNKVDQVLVLTSYKVNEHRPSTRDAVEITRPLTHIHVVAGISIQNYKERDLRELADFLKDGMVKGLKLYPGYEPVYAYDRRCQVLYDLAQEFDVPVMIHTGDTYNPKGKVRFSHPLTIDDVAVDNPGLKIVICHIGNPWIRDCMEVVYKNKNCTADISGLVLGDFKSHFKRFMLQQNELYETRPSPTASGWWRPAATKRASFSDPTSVCSSSTRSNGTTSPRSPAHARSACWMASAMSSTSFASRRDGFGAPNRFPSVSL
jgi:hypothetical protein